MRFFSGTRDKSKSKTSASALFKQKQNAKPGMEMTKDEQYKKMLEDRTAKLVEDAMMGKKAGFKLPGTKQDDKPKELSKNAKEMMEMLAMKKAQKDRKDQKKKEVEWQRQQKSIKSAKSAEDRAAEAAIEQAKKEYMAKSNYFFGGNNDDKSGW